MSKNNLNKKDTLIGINLIKNDFELKISKSLNILKVPAPLFVLSDTGLNDNLSGSEKPVEFKIRNYDASFEIVQSLAKWKRFSLKKYDFQEGEGLFADMRAIRRDENISNIHSILVDQWDYEIIISEKDKNISFLKNTVQTIVSTMCKTQKKIKEIFPQLESFINEDVFFITSEELLALYPNLSPKERENKIAETHKTVFIIGIGDKLSNNELHDTRAFDYDDWNLNGDIIIWYPPLGRAIELSSMGIRVNEKTLLVQAKKLGIKEDDFKKYHSDILSKRYPQTLGGGIGQSRFFMVLLNKKHIGEVQSSFWGQNEGDNFL